MYNAVEGERPWKEHEVNSTGSRLLFVLSHVCQCRLFGRVCIIIVVARVCVKHFSLHAFFGFVF